MTLVQLRHFVTLVEQGSYAQAAKALYLTQPALTRSIQALEEDLGAQLFDRFGRRTVLTTFGTEILRRARQLVSDAEALKQASKSLQAGLVGHLRIGLSSAPGALFSIPLMLHLAEHHPRLKLDISRGRTNVLLTLVREQQLDAGFLVRPGHPLAQLDRPASLREVLTYPIASTPLSEEVARYLVTCYGPEANPDDMVTLRCDETLSLVQAARQSNVVLLTVLDVAPDLVHVPVAPHPDGGTVQRPGARFGLVTLSQRQGAPALHILRELLEKWTKLLTSERPAEVPVQTSPMAPKGS